MLLPICAGSYFNMTTALSTEVDATSTAWMTAQSSQGITRICHSPGSYHGFHGPVRSTAIVRQKLM